LSIDAPQEVAQTVLLLNDLLERLAAVLRREKGTIANIAHELRSPISGLRSMMEVAAITEMTDQNLAKRCLPTVVAMHGMVSNLLALARLEAGQEQISVQTINCSDLIQQCWTTIEPLAQQRQQTLVCQVLQTSIRASVDQVRMIMTILLDNAIAHSPEKSNITVHCMVTATQTCLRWSNPFLGTPPDLTRIFEPFWRADAARTSPHHAGLGLVLAQRLSRLIGATLTVEIHEDHFIASLGIPHEK
jgi:signal transduction histidine kinase